MKRMIFICVLFSVLLFMLCGCRSVKYVPVETVRTEYKDRIVKDSSSTNELLNIRDSIITRDSIVHVVDERGNVLRTEIWKWKERFRESNYLLEKLKNKYDSLCSVKRDSVRVPYPVEKELTRWQKVKLEVGGFAIAAIFVLILIVFGKMVYKIKKGG